MASYCHYDKRRNIMVISDFFFFIVKRHILWQWKLFFFLWSESLEPYFRRVEHLQFPSNLKRKRVTDSPFRYFLQRVLQDWNLWFTETEILEKSDFNVFIVFSISDLCHSWTWTIFSVFLPHHDLYTLQEFSPGNTSSNYERFCRVLGASYGALRVL